MPAEGGPHPAYVVVVEGAGPHLILLAEWGGHSIHLIYSKTSSAPAPGDTLYPRVRMDRAVWWDKAKGETP